MLGSVYGGLFYNIASEQTAFLVTLTCDIVCAVICVPLIFGYAGVCIRLVRGEDCPLSELFAPYSSLSRLTEVYAFFVKTIPPLLFKLILPVLVLSYLYYELDTYLQWFYGDSFEILKSTLKTVYFIPAALIILGCMYLFGKNIRAFLIFCSGDTVFLQDEYHGFAFYRLRLSLIPLYFISFLTFGILFIAYTLPFTIIVYSLFLRFDEYTEEGCTEDGEYADLQNGIYRPDGTATAAIGFCAVDSTYAGDTSEDQTIEFESISNTAVFNKNDNIENN